MTTNQIITSSAKNCRRAGREDSDLAKTAHKKTSSGGGLLLDHHYGVTKRGLLNCGQSSSAKQNFVSSVESALTFDGASKGKQGQ